MELQLLRVRESTGQLTNSPQAIYQTMKAEAYADRECFWVLHLDTKYHIIDKELAHMGTLNASLIHPREVFRKAIINSSAAIITVHNHPSGDCTPSPEDKLTWEKLRKAGDILVIEVTDNLIISPNSYYSEKGS